MVGLWGAALLSLLLCASARAEVLHLATGDDYAPFTGKALPGQGMLTQVVRAALAEQGSAITLDWLPWNRGYLKARRVEYDATFPYVRSAEREAEFLYSAPIYVSEQYIFSRAGDHIELDDLPAMIGRRLCYPLGWQPPPVIQQLLDAGQLVRHSPAGLNECALLLLMERDDFFISDRRLGETALRLTGVPVEQFRRSESAISSSTLHLIVPRRHPQAAVIIAQFNQGLALLRANGDYQRLLERWHRSLKEADDWLAELNFGNARQRVAGLVLKMRSGFDNSVVTLFSREDKLEAAVEADDELDAILAEETFDVIALIEDEIIMGLPLSLAISRMRSMTARAGSFSMSPTRRRSSRATSVTASPDAPARPVRPMRCT